MNVDQLLKRSADFQSMFAPDDRLNALIQDVLNDELFEDDLDFVAAARQERPMPDDLDK